MCPLTAFGNDGRFYSNGSNIYPVKENEISVDKEILSITHFSVINPKTKIEDWENWIVDVYFEFNNPTRVNKEIQLGFAAKINTRGIDAESILMEYSGIKDFIIEVNGKNIDIKDKSFNKIRNEKSGDNFVCLFTADFKPGKNIIKHSYKCRGYMGDAGQMSGSAYGINYILKTGAGWANGMIKDFTLKISSMENELWTMDEILSEPYKVQGLFKKVKNRLFTKAGAEILISKKNFHPEKDLDISVKGPWYLSASYPLNDLALSEYFGKESEKNFKADIFIPLLFACLKSSDKELEGMHKSTLRILRNTLYAVCGYVFKDSRINDFFSNYIFYIPDKDFSEDKIPAEFKERIKLVKNLEDKK